MEDTATFDEAAARLQVSTRTIERMVARGDLNTARIGRRRSIITASIDALLRPSGACLRSAARVLTSEEVEQQLRWMADQVAIARSRVSDAG